MASARLGKLDHDKVVNISVKTNENKKFVKSTNLAKKNNEAINIICNTIAEK